jgi:hypothetical protein
MPLTRFPNGITVNSTTALSYTTAAGDGAIDCNNLYVAGVSSIATAIMTNSTITTLLVTNATVTTLLATNGTVTTLSVPSTGRFSISSGTGATMIGERAYIPFNFTSAATTIYQATPFAGQIIDCWVTSDTTPRTISGFTIQAGSAGAVAVATVNTCVFATAVGQQFQPVLTVQPITTASAIACVVTTAGSAANFSAMVVLQRSA